MTAKAEKRWNHNIHYHREILQAVPEGAQRALDVGCGEGMLARELRRTVPNVAGIDLDTPSIDQAREYADDVHYVCDNFLTHPFEPGSFDFVASVATLHHMDAIAGLTGMRDLLRPGGVLAVVGLAAGTIPKDLPYALTGATVGTLHRLVRGRWEHPSPTVWPPPATYSEMRTLASDVLPGSRYRRHLLLRYSITWRKPEAYRASPCP